MSDKKSLYKTPDVRIVDMAVTEALLTASAGATLPGVQQDEMEYEF